MGWHNTGCLAIMNETDEDFTVIDGENQGYSIVVPSHGSNTFNGVIFPWCDDALDIRQKAFRFFRGAADPPNGSFYMFEWYPETIYWTRYNWVPGGYAEASFENRVHAGAPTSSYVVVGIGTDFTPRAVQAMA